MLNTEKYRSVRWLKGGRVHPELDCFGVVNEIRGDLGLPLYPDFAGVTKDGGGLDRSAKEYIQKMIKCSPEPGALALCFSGSVVTHVGIVIVLDDCLKVAECNPGINVTFVDLARFIRRFSRVEFWQ
ncbi:nitrite transporter [Pluralibacter gergoviae]|uniref:nitrite transporter n=1 Tax=Pluralibacter gergoviae TaxID=61647 RepID=UPI0008DC02F1|nr:nitrite transporter [Pluralibacter gergoviae]OHY63780.1 nitrite transporter [Pluralibacter gergoviae]